MPDPYLQFPIARFPFCTSNHRVCAAVSTLHIDHLRDTVEENKFAVSRYHAHRPLRDTVEENYLAISVPVVRTQFLGTADLPQEARATGIDNIGEHPMFERSRVPFIKCSE